MNIAESMQSHWLLRDSQNKALKDAEQPEKWVDWRRDHLCDYGDCSFFFKPGESLLENHCSLLESSAPLKLVLFFVVR